METLIPLLISITAALGFVALGLGAVILAPYPLRPVRRGGREQPAFRRRSVAPNERVTDLASTG